MIGYVKPIMSCFLNVWNFVLQSQMEGLQNSHGNEVTKMQKQIDDLENNVIRLQIQNTKESNSSDR